MTNKKPSKGKIRGYVMAGAGFIMILANSLDYLLGGDGEFTPVGIIGLVFVAIGLRIFRDAKEKK
ncbi:MAG: hypothetical protein GKB99_04555 [Methanocellales archaeon]|nr:hypothetical protein [Methanocellales archaeon]